ncbi:heterodisulfide reductase, subunit B [candidate division WOR-3 bacterium 4484_100]|uniref:Heterodisulfide reductase, subunit B n=1 Tax=candidate division WOR-3 bacterium 4484_100 TaxID=1936077 RepID=A0A1V4QGR2_UNCW3|nr:MAG: heterodisulfide reductase, subunit B [candidate division WOR-3 bacterium 4484_100]
MRIAYYPGCTLKTTAKNFETSAIAIAQQLGVEFVELPRWTCCGTVFSLTSDDLIHHVAPIRNLIRVQEMVKRKQVDDEKRILTLCSMCFNTLKRSNLRVKENIEDLKKINNLMYLEEDYCAEIEVIHLLQLLKEIGFDKIKAKVKNPLNNLKVAPYYGCMILRPLEVGIDDPEDPTIQRDLLEALGAEVIDNPYKKVCCGSYQTVNNKEKVAELAFDILTHAQREGAEAITTCCPLCSFNLDFRQKEVLKKHPDFKQIPVFYITQLIAVAFGLDNKTLGFDQNYVDPKLLLKNKGLIK